LGVLGSQVIGRVILGARDSRGIVLTIACQAKGAIDRTLVALDGPVTALGISVDQADREIALATLVDRADLVIDQEILADRTAQALETVCKIYQVASKTGTDGRTGVRNIVTISATGGKITLVTTAIGLTTRGGMTITSTGPTTLASVTGHGPPGMG
jgi:hypothetical protein